MPILDDYTPTDEADFEYDLGKLNKIKNIKIANETSEARNDFGVWLVKEYAEEADITWTYDYNFEFADISFSS